MNFWLYRSLAGTFRIRRPGRILLGLLVYLCIFKVAAAQTVRVNDDTDWWSLINETHWQSNVKEIDKDIGGGTFEIAGVVLGSGQFSNIATEMGKAPDVERGDAATGRDQVCYVAAGRPQTVYLVFEYGEMVSDFYLFRGGPNWTGQNLCVRTKLVSIGLGTKSGLRLGLSRARVEGILGKPDDVSGDRLVYARNVREKTTPAEFETLRKDDPEHLSDAEAHKEFDYYTREIYIEARFGKSGMNYLAVSTSASD